MSNRSTLEFNHDYCPDDDYDAKNLGLALQSYLRSGDKTCLPMGVALIERHHHSEPPNYPSDPGIKGK